ncbi:protein transport protein Sec24-like At4g32640 [Gossypium raimondii]|uniref:protein transport protein Sec24-like At4g32640 n=1 Tax=Gossypium raimondii TaxID=29730 RepID=UPI00227B5EBD|nr:protein transport protein Sec24-like At4g32640 [Gossypium raimondii]
MGAPLDYIRTLIVPSILSYARQIHSNPINSTRKLISFDVEVIIKVPVNIDDDDDEVDEPNDDDDDDGDALDFKPATYFSVQTLRRYKWGDDEEQDCLPLKKRRRLREGLSSTNKECAICLNEFSEGDEIASMPCTHVFHDESHHAVVIHLHQPLQQNYRIPTCPLLQVRDHVTNLCIIILLSYRKFCATVSSTGQLILPEALKLLPLYTLALIKCGGLRNDGRIDDRFFWFNYVSSLSTPLAIPLVYPRMFAILNVDTKDGDESVLPPTVPLSSEHVCDDGIYLLENGEDALIYFGSSVDSSILQQLFGFTSVDEVPTQFVMQQFSNPLSKNFNDVVNVIRQQRWPYLRFTLCKKRDPSGKCIELPSHAKL